MRNIEKDFTFNGTRYGINADFYVNSDDNFEIVNLNLWDLDADVEVLDFKACSPFYPADLDDVVADEAMEKKINAVILDEVDQGILAW
jgi:hypothetical protein